MAEICQDLAVANQLLPAADEVYASFVIGYGSLLVIGGDDVYGDEMNLACKLGEDLAERGEVLLTQAAFEGLQEGPGGSRSCGSASRASASPPTVCCSNSGPPPLIRSGVVEAMPTCQVAARYRK